MVILKVLTPFIFPENEMPAPVKTTFAPLSASAMGVPMNEFLKLTRIPIVIYYGDFIAEKPDTAVGPDKWRSEYEMAKQFVMTVNRHGGDATLVHLPDICLLYTSRVSYFTTLVTTSYAPLSLTGATCSTC